MSMHRKNTAKGAKRLPNGEADWFAAQRKRNRRRNELAKISRRKNRK